MLPLSESGESLDKLCNQQVGAQLYAEEEALNNNEVEDAMTNDASRRAKNVLHPSGDQKDIHLAASSQKKVRLAPLFSWELS